MQGSHHRARQIVDTAPNCRQWGAATQSTIPRAGSWRKVNKKGTWSEMKQATPNSFSAAATSQLSFCSDKQEKETKQAVPASLPSFTLTFCELTGMSLEQANGWKAFERARILLGSFFSRSAGKFFPLFLQGGPLPVISEVITPCTHGLING